MKNNIINWLRLNRLKLLMLYILVVITYMSIPFLGYDNPLEQGVEWVIKIWTGIDVELTPQIITENFPVE